MQSRKRSGACTEIQTGYAKLKQTYYTSFSIAPVGGPQTRRCNTLAETTEFLEDQKIEWTGHPPYSPDLASNDFYLFPSVKNKFLGHRFSSREEAVHVVRNACFGLP
ncbi:hypothetical protein EVAR_34817_1 [Eumeta japonica]|uniref:Histone-lysine N-methyltransferase SETMAR n=1 Tax=Eumeta variegata TaxID=151549 RepID=A0A4C1WDR5_EUMVA|nr:hypothetical protein EVAR_34817_1 [Eumeta japonica]